MNEVTTVSRCDATTCRFNTDHKCAAGQVEISMSAQSAQCMTYSAAPAAQGTQPSAGQ